MNVTFFLFLHCFSSRSRIADILKIKNPNFNNLKSRWSTAVVGTWNYIHAKSEKLQYLIARHESSRENQNDQISSLFLLIWVYNFQVFPKYLKYHVLLQLFQEVRNMES